MPKSEPHDTWVIDTGIPRCDAATTSSPVKGNGNEPVAGLHREHRWDMVSATRPALINPPAAMATPTPRIAVTGESMLATSNKAAIFGVSLKQP